MLLRGSRILLGMINECLGDGRVVWLFVATMFRLVMDQVYIHIYTFSFLNIYHFADYPLAFSPASAEFGYWICGRKSAKSSCFPRFSSSRIITQRATGCY